MKTISEHTAEIIANALADAMNSKDKIDNNITDTYVDDYKCYVKRTFCIKNEIAGKENHVSFAMTEEYPRKVIKRIDLDGVDNVSLMDDVLTIDSDGYRVCFKAASDE